ncbi:unnamed protein product [Bursaphelenchus okinawaensis]|uniref:Exocyst complex component Sec8 n=1 Tax=Bursaphelenchus okinawaensis TaxID=465554 RepID=A0A811JX93_9BILA|nr:unnamed protein product [Bursaphelenchus okinawaensis]CAG9086757.1 unnamed protein product [Bursaphelenchus okinawaensis]
MVIGNQKKISEAKDVSSGLLINVIRTIATSASDDQRELARERLQTGYQDSGKVIDRLLTEQEEDVKTSVESFRDVATNIRECRERINRVQNALSASRNLLQSRRDELKKLWMENLEQKKIGQILEQIEEVKNMERIVDGLMKEEKFREAVDKLKRADIALNGPLSAIEGLHQLRTNIIDTSQHVLNVIIEKLLEWLVAEPFERQLFEVIRKLSESAIAESAVCARLLEKKYPDFITNITGTQTQIGVDLAKDRKTELNLKIVDALEALMVFDQLDTALDQLALRTPKLCKTALSDTVNLLSTLHANEGLDSNHLVHFINVLIAEMRACFYGHKILADEVGRLRMNEECKKEVIWRYWDGMQSVMETVVSDHVDIYPMKSDTQEKTVDKRRILFRFSNTAAVSGSTGIVAKQQPFALICPADPYNIIPIFHPLNRFCHEIEANIDQSPCKLHTFLHAFVMDIFIERIRKDMDQKIDYALSGNEVWQTLATVGGSKNKILVSCKRVFELCEQIGQFINSMDAYTQRFASLWVLIMEEYTKTATEMYSRITHSRTVQGDKMTEHSKTSANWAVDEDISRLLKSLPSWQVVVNQTPLTGDMTPGGILSLNESEQDIRLRTQRESEILISNLGSLAKIDHHAVITDINHAKAIICMHESLQWFSQNMRHLIATIPTKAKQAMKCLVHIRSPDGQVVEQLLSDALEQRLASVEQMSETCLLMLHLELRVHCFYHLLPLARGNAQDENDREIENFRRDLTQFHLLLTHHIAANKLKYLFDGLGHLCASIFIHCSQYIQKLTENGRKRVCRTIFAVQKTISKLTARPEAELTRAQVFFELLNKSPDQLLAQIRERGRQFTDLEYRYLLALAIRSHPVLSSQHGVLELKLNQLNEILSQARK